MTTYIDTFMKLLSYLICAFHLLAKIKIKIQNIDFSLCLYRFYRTICAMKIKELLRNF